MNKKLKLFLALSLVIQLLVPSSLLIYHYSLLSTAQNLDTEYRFELGYFSLDYYYDFKSENPTDHLDGPIYLNISGVSSRRNSKYTVVSTPKNNVVSLQTISEKTETDVWFYGRCFTEEIAPVSYSFAEGTDPDTIRAQIRAEYNLKNQRDRESAYLTAKIYRGVFLPTAIYFRGEKIIDITL